MSIYKNEKNTIIIFIAIIIIIFILAGTIFSYQNLEQSIIKEDLRTISNDTYEVKYSNYWKDVFGSENGFELKRNDNFFKLDIRKLEDNEIGKDISELSNELMNEISNLKEYNLKINDKTEIGERKYECFQKMLEGKNDSMMLYTIKDYKNLYNFSLKANNKDFDNVVVEAESDLNYFVIENERVSNYVKDFFANKEASFSEDTKLDDMIIQNSNVVLKENNYEVTFSLPSNFMQDKEKEDFVASFKGLNASDQGSISLKINIINENSIEYFTSNKDFLLEKTKLKDSKHTSFTEAYGELNENIYLYKVSYLYNPWKEAKSTANVEEGTDTKYETCFIVYAINKEKSVLVRIDAKTSGITRKLINSLIVVNAKEIQE